MTLYRNASDFIPLPMIPLTELAGGNATGREDLARRNLMKAEGAGKIGVLLCVSASLVASKSDGDGFRLGVNFWRHIWKRLATARTKALERLQLLAANITQG